MLTATETTTTITMATATRPQQRDHHDKTTTKEHRLLGRRRKSVGKGKESSGWLTK
jgi:hypothetical protein